MKRHQVGGDFGKFLKADAKSYLTNFNQTSTHYFMAHAVTYCIVTFF